MWPTDPSDVRSDKELSLYAKTDEKFYYRNFAGDIQQLGGDGAGGGGIQFDTYPQDGGYLYLSADDEDPAHGRSFYFKGMHGFDFINADGSDGNFDIEQYSTSNDLNIYSDSSMVNIQGRGGLILEGKGDGGVQMQADGDGNMDISHRGPTGRIRIESENDRLDIIGQTTVSITTNAGDLLLEAMGAAESVVSITAHGSSTFMGPIKHVIYGYAVADLGNKPGHLFRVDSGWGGGARVEFVDGATGTVLMRLDVNSSGVPSYHIQTGASWVADL
jgi:hypothetical protein